jgi:hypothetical protein
MKGDLLLRVLKAIGAATVAAADIAETIVSAPYGASRGTLERALSARERLRAQASAKRHAQQRYYNLILRLKRDGLVEEKTKRGGKIFTLTKRGIAKLHVLQARAKNPFPAARYQKMPADTWTIVAFDVPEREKRKREWLRAALQRLGFTLVQKSVWIGKAKLPKEFLDDLAELRLLDAVEIFGITRAGSLKHVA